MKVRRSIAAASMRISIRAAFHGPFAEQDTNSEREACVLMCPEGDCVGIQRYWVELRTKPTARRCSARHFGAKRYISASAAYTDEDEKVVEYRSAMVRGTDIGGKEQRQ